MPGIQIDMQPLGPEVMRQRLQEFLAQNQPAPGFEVPGAPSGMVGNLPENKQGYEPFDPASSGSHISSDGAPQKLKAMIETAAGENNIDPALLDALVSTESSYDPMCRSRAGAMGLTQLMPENVKELGVGNPFDPMQNLQGGAKQLSQLLTKYHGKIDLALAAYNAGPGAVAKHGGIPPYTETQNYVKKVMSLYHLRSHQK